MKAMDNLISVIIPTVQKNKKVLYKLINILKEDSCVGEIIVINNYVKNLPIEFYMDKVKMFKTSENYYVNRSWNFGVQNSMYETFLIINDDILPVKNLCKKIIQSKILEQEDTGLVGIDTSSIVMHDRDSVKDIDIPSCKNKKLNFEELPNYLGTSDWGSAFFGKKENYYKIPEDLKIIYGDNYLLYKNLKNHKKNYKMGGLPFNHIHSLSSQSTEFNDIVANDSINANKYFPHFS